jgi:hypothetical protein
LNGRDRRSTTTATGTPVGKERGTIMTRNSRRQALKAGATLALALAFAPAFAADPIKIGFGM